MGIIYECSCSSCGFKKEFFLGGGFNSCSLERNFKAISVEEREEIEKLQESNLIERFEIENKITKCEKCKIIGNKTIISIWKKNGEKIIFGNKCNKCKDELIVFDNICVKETTCPQCQKSDADYKEVGHWD